ncbi:MAG: NADH-quinone oxidoreductase chain 5 [Verrucomicrobia subdivision 3 bacterium]|nr:NADH-quinone oxidoreductase chain 5 [Limisphaerales bacterium]MCS1415052.1 NADH-quinone oxidoreductase chain 5 [Limisphaerales bacterium]
MSAAAKRLAQKLRKAFSGIAGKETEFRNEWTIEISDGAKIAEACQFAKSELGFDFLVDISSVDNYGDDPRFEVVYELYGYEHQSHLRLVTAVSEEAAELPTVSTVWRTADWHEREVYDMMGIRFEGHPDLRRILMWEGYPYFPLRKDFPLAGKETDFPEVAFSREAPLEGGPFVTTPGADDRGDREPRAKSVIS